MVYGIYTLAFKGPLYLDFGAYVDRLWGMLLPGDSYVAPFLNTCCFLNSQVSGLGVNGLGLGLIRLRAHKVQCGLDPGPQHCAAWTLRVFLDSSFREPGKGVGGELPIKQN